MTTGSGRLLLLALGAVVVGCEVGPRREAPKPIERERNSLAPFEPQDLLGSAPLDRDAESERAAVAAALARWVDELIVHELGPIGALVDPLVELRRRLVEENVESALETAVWHDVAGGWTCKGPSAHVHLQVDSAGPRAELQRLARDAAARAIDPAPIAVRVLCRDGSVDEELRRVVEGALRAKLSEGGYTLAPVPDRASDPTETLADVARGQGVDHAYCFELSVTTKDNSLQVDCSVESMSRDGHWHQTLHSFWRYGALDAHAANIGHVLGERLVLRLKTEPQALQLGAALTRWEDPLERRLILVTIAGMGDDAVAATPALVRAATNDPDSQVRSVATTTLGKLGPAARHAASGLVVTTLRSERADVRVAAATVLGLIKGDSDAAVAALIACLEDRALDVRVAAMRSLGEIGPPAAQAVPYLVDLLQHAEFRMRVAAAHALRSTATPDATVLAALEALRDRDRDVEVREVATETLRVLQRQHTPR